MLEKSRNNKKRVKRGLFDLAMVAIILFAAEDVYRVSLRYLHASNFSGLLLFCLASLAIAAPAILEDYEKKIYQKGWWAGYHEKEDSLKEQNTGD